MLPIYLKFVIHVLKDNCYSVTFKVVVNARYHVFINKQLAVLVYTIHNFNCEKNVFTSIRALQCKSRDRFSLLSRSWTCGQVFPNWEICTSFLETTYADKYKLFHGDETQTRNRMSLPPVDLQPFNGNQQQWDGRGTTEDTERLRTCTACLYLCMA